jgi:hypothetical protein
VSPLTIGVVGPPDLVDFAVAVGQAPATVRLVPLPYSHEDEAADLVRDAQDDVDGVLFTGVIPHTRANTAGALHRPAEHVSYSGATLLRALVEQLRLGRDASCLSIDTLAPSQVFETLAEARLPTDRVEVLEYSAEQTSGQIVDFHRSAHSQHGTTLAITCLGSAYAALRGEMHAVRLAPSRHSVRGALRQLILTIEGLRTGDAQVAIGIVDLAGAPDDLLRADFSVLGGVLATIGDQYLLVCTSGPLDQATAHYRRLSVLDALAERHATAHIGFGVGRTAAEAESLARRALGRAQATGAHAAAVALADDTDIVITTSHGRDAPADAPPENIALLARRAGVGRETLVRLRELAASLDGKQITTNEVAEQLVVQLRTARRVLKRLERAGVARPTGTTQDGTIGRPRIVYELLL